MKNSLLINAASADSVGRALAFGSNPPDQAWHISGMSNGSVLVASEDHVLNQDMMAKSQVWGPVDVVDNIGWNRFLIVFTCWQDVRHGGEVWRRAFSAYNF